jgi:hypothetical protein
LLLPQFVAGEIPKRGPTRLAVAHARSDLCFNVSVQVVPEFFVKLILDPPARKKRPHSQPQYAPKSHRDLTTSTPDVGRRLPMRRRPAISRFTILTTGESMPSHLSEEAGALQASQAVRMTSDIAADNRSHCAAS